VEAAELRERNHGFAGFSITSLARSAPQLLAPIAERALGLLAAGTVQVDVTTVLPLERAADAHRVIEERRSTGKTVLTIDAG
jgi:NADPH2:quinone reductase